MMSRSPKAAIRAPGTLRPVFLQVLALTAAAVFLTSCAPRDFSPGHKDSLRAGPFWERNEQRD